jgi:hypothetical protein
MSACEKCGIDYDIGDWPFCPHGRGSYGVTADSIPGGVAKKRGLTNKVEHIGIKGGDKSKFTTRWY